jgi:hypothetical protein
MQTYKPLFVIVSVILMIAALVVLLADKGLPIALALAISSLVFYMGKDLVP